MIGRETLGPEAEHERSGFKLYRDTRTSGARVVEALKGPASGFILAAMAIGVVAEPASIDLLVPLALLYAVWVLTRRVMLLLRLPKGARRKDYNHPQPGQRKPRMSEGVVHIGSDFRTNQQLWIGNEDARQHVAVPGTTGAGKTEALLGLVSNALTHDSGFIFVDGKADNRLYAKVSALARKIRARGRCPGAELHGRYRQQALEHLQSLCVRQCGCHPRAFGQPDRAEPGRWQCRHGNHVFMARAVALMGALAPALVWMRDKKGVPIDIEKIRFATELQSIASLAFERRFRRLHVDTGQVEDDRGP